MVSTSCPTLGTFYLNTFPLPVNAVALKVVAELTLISFSQTPQIAAASQYPPPFQPMVSICSAMPLTCLRASTHPAPHGEKGNPLCFIPLVIPVSKTEWQRVENWAWMRQVGAVLELCAQERWERSWTPLEAVGCPVQLLQVPVWFWWDWNPLCNHRVRLHQHLSRLFGFLLANEQSSARQCFQLPGWEHLTCSFMGVRVK